jgi:hypothetical protein
MFHELLDDPIPIEPGILQAQARREFESVVSRSHFRKRVANEPIPTGNVLVFGAASYSRLELAMLDEIENAHQKWEDSWSIYVFDVAVCRSPAELQGYLPQEAIPKQTPMLQVWNSGILDKSECCLLPIRKVLCNLGILPCP